MPLFSDRDERPLHIHIVGIGGAGMSPLARILIQRGHAVSGSDQETSPVTESLAAAGITVYRGHRAENILGADLVVATAAARPDNPELVAAAEQGIRTIKGATLLGELMLGHRCICVAGTHGKTTTTAMISLILTDAGLDPTYVIGGEPLNLAASGHLGAGEYFVAEADEFDRRFLSLHPVIEVITGVEPDHPDCYPTKADLMEAFRQFVSLIPSHGTLVGCADSDAVQWLASTAVARFASYGIVGTADWQAVDLTINNGGGTDFRVTHYGDDVGKFRLEIPGRHNVSNALAAIAVAELVGVEMASVRRSLAGFRGVARRFQTAGQALGATLIDDYAHHPSEIRATLAAARQRYPGRRIIAVHQPHTYSRLKALLPDFATAFGDADMVLIVDIYPSRETDTLGIHARHLVDAMRHPRALYVGNLVQATEYLRQALRPEDVVITLGAGNVNRILADLKSDSQTSRSADNPISPNPV